MAHDRAARTVMVTNQAGLDLGAGTKFVRLAGTFPCEVRVVKDDHEVNGKSLMGLLMLVASKGTTLTITASGERAEEAVAALSQLVVDRFGYAS